MKFFLLSFPIELRPICFGRFPFEFGEMAVEGGEGVEPAAVGQFCHGAAFVSHFLHELARFFYAVGIDKIVEAFAVVLVDGNGEVGAVGAYGIGHFDEGDFGLEIYFFFLYEPFKFFCHRGYQLRWQGEFAPVACVFGMEQRLFCQLGNDGGRFAAGFRLFGDNLCLPLGARQAEHLVLAGVDIKDGPQGHEAEVEECFVDLGCAEGGEVEQIEGAEHSGGGGHPLHAQVFRVGTVVFNLPVVTPGETIDEYQGDGGEEQGNAVGDGLDDGVGEKCIEQGTQCKGSGACHDFPAGGPAGADCFGEEGASQGDAQQIGYAE